MYGKAGLRPNDAKPCSICEKPLFDNGVPMAYRVIVETHVADVAEIRQLAGLELMLGSVGVARAMSPVSHVTQVIDTLTELVCLKCLIETRDLLPRLIDARAEQEHQNG